MQKHIGRYKDPSTAGARLPNCRTVVRNDESKSYKYGRNDKFHISPPHFRHCIGYYILCTVL